MTEDEARKKWCPWARQTWARWETNGEAGWRTSGDQTGFNVAVISKGEEAYRTPCIASACMAWRWSADGLELSFIDGKPILRKVGGEALHGFCGLAGAPS